MNDVTEELRALVVDQLDVTPEDVKPDADLVSDLGADSLDVVELVMAIEEAFEVSIADSETEAVRTFGDAVALVQGKRQALAASA